MLSGVAFGINCDSDTDCEEANNVCSTNCVCSFTSFRNNAGNACVNSRFYNRI